MWTFFPRQQAFRQVAIKLFNASAAPDSDFLGWVPVTGHGDGWILLVQALLLERLSTICVIYFRFSWTIWVFEGGRDCKMADLDAFRRVAINHQILGC